MNSATGVHVGMVVKGESGLSRIHQIPRLGKNTPIVNKMGMIVRSSGNMPREARAVGVAGRCAIGRDTGAAGR